MDIIEYILLKRLVVGGRRRRGVTILKDIDPILLEVLDPMTLEEIEGVNETELEIVDPYDDGDLDDMTLYDIDYLDETPPEWFSRNALAKLVLLECLDVIE